MPMELFGPNVGKMKRNNDVDGLLRVIRRDRSGAAEIQHKKDAVDALCSMGGPAVQAILDLYADMQVDPVVRDYLSLHPKEPSAFEQSHELLARHVDGLVELVRRGESWAAETQTKKDAIDALCSMGEPAVQAILDLLYLDDGHVTSYLEYDSTACKECLKSPKVAAAMQRGWERRLMLAHLKKPPVDPATGRKLRRMTRSQLDRIASHLGVEADPHMTTAQLSEAILAGRVRVESPTTRGDRIQALIDGMGSGNPFTFPDNEMKGTREVIIKRAAEAGAANDPSVLAPLQKLRAHRVSETVRRSMRRRKLLTPPDGHQKRVEVLAVQTAELELPKAVTVLDEVAPDATGHGLTHRPDAAVHGEEQ